MRITIEIDSDKEMEKLSALLKAFDINSVNVLTHEDIPVTNGDKNIDPIPLFGIWANNPRTIEDIRNQAWSRKNG
ncbi:hypothetical protein FO440_17320 [Mucilaginibacter corticis]|uniref:Uncharacterized protein n=1 Tax=Mucilaginibacter corticis TaxID=2597670 RepID=A0A556MHW4_9SPHI|nr:hypothetical protein [Mucilaginibacter corticis]TSJ39504.1 hypothetical protein FO440_17320 [Mucilaginibacter corticis]